MVSTLAYPGSILIVPETFSDEKIVDVAGVNHRRCFEESGQWHENVGRTHLVLASGKLVLQKLIDFFVAFLPTSL